MKLNPPFLKYHIQWHERQHGQLFCDESARYLVEALLSEARDAEILLNCTIERVEKVGGSFLLETNRGSLSCDNLIIATGGLSIPKMGATNFGHLIAKQFGHSIIEPRAGLVPLRYSAEDSQHLSPLSGISLEVEISCKSHSFREQLLFTHRGISGPAVLQISNYCKQGESITINLLPGEGDLESRLLEAREKHPKQQLKTALSLFFPERLAKILSLHYVPSNNSMGALSNSAIAGIAHTINNFNFRPNGTEGYRTAEATLGGVNTKEISSKTMESKITPHLYFIGEVLDVTGHLGGVNFHWAWSSGSAAGKMV